MSKKQNLLDSIMNYSVPTDELQTLGNRANHAISSIINILEAIDNNFDEQIAEDLQRRLFLSIKNRDYRKFEKGLENLTIQEKRSRRKDEKNKDIKENASAGATSSGSIASVPSGLHYPILTRIPKSNFFGYKEVKSPKNKKGE